MAGRGRGIYVSIRIAAPLETIWRLTQHPGDHARWDARFSRIVPLRDLDGGGYRFRYERALPGHLIEGTGTSIGERVRPDGSRTSALRFQTSDPWSPIRSGRGYWRYTTDGESTVFTTGYDYTPGWGRLLDAIIVRRLLGWLTAWSFDRLRIWAERGTPPETWPVTSVVQVWRRDRPRASRCERKAPGRDVFAESPSTLETLEAP